ncbi:MAG: PilZ domain-containing protein [Planctomycetes bacterium]|nr:PilZ domain-containing protein [Planctomycetota bacterium]
MSEELKELVRQIERAATPRRLTRCPVNIPVWVEAQGARIEGRGRDLNEHGLRARMSRPLSMNERVWVHLELPGFQHTLAVQADVRWVRADGGPSQYCVGLEFRHTDETRGALRHLLVMHARKALPQIQRSGHTTRRRLPKVDPKTLSEKPPDP